MAGSRSITMPAQPSLEESNFDVVTVSCFMLYKDWHGWRVKHMTTDELRRPLAIPGYDPCMGDPGLYRNHFTDELVSGQKCTYCSLPATGASTYPQDSVPWMKWAAKISRTDPSPVIWGPPFVDMILKTIPPSGGDVYGSSLADRIRLSKKLKTVGFYRPTRNYIGIPICGHQPCQVKALNDIKAFFKEQGFGPYLPLFLQPFTTALGNPVCQVCGSEKIRLCKKDGHYCGFGYCGREHQTLDWPNHKEACKYHRAKSTSTIAPPSKKPLICHIFIGDPDKNLRYWCAANSVDPRLVDTTEAYHFENFPEFVKVLDDTQHSSLEGDENGPLKCAICLTQQAVTSGTFHSVPITADETESYKHTYYKSMLRLYHKANAFQGKSWIDSWEEFEDLRSRTAQMAALFVPVCNQRACLRQTTGKHNESIKKIMSNGGDIIPPGRFSLTQLWP